MRRCIVLVIVLQLPARLLAWQGTAEPPLFETHVRPILKAHCWQCHGEEDELKGALDARLARFLAKGGDSGPAIVPGDHDESLLYQRVTPARCRRARRS